LYLFVSFHFSHSILQLLPYVRLISRFIFGAAAENPATELGFWPANWTVPAWDNVFIRAHRLEANGSDGKPGQCQWIFCEFASEAQAAWFVDTFNPVAACTPPYNTLTSSRYATFITPN
jgi:hypothetical protein